MNPLPYLPPPPDPLHSGLRGVVCPTCSAIGTQDGGDFHCLNFDCPEHRDSSRCRGCDGKRRIGAHGKFVCVSGTGFPLVEGACPEWEEHSLFCPSCGAPGKESSPFGPGPDRWCRDPGCPDSVSWGAPPPDGEGPGRLVFGTGREARFVRWKWDLLLASLTDPHERMLWEHSTGKRFPDRFDWEGFSVQFSRRETGRETERDRMKPVSRPGAGIPAPDSR